MQRITDNVYFVEGRNFDSNSIIVLGSKPFVVDTGTGIYPEALELAFRELDLTIDTIVNTHCHFDHVGGNHFFDAKVYAHRPDDEHLRTADSYCVAASFHTPLAPQDVSPLEKEFRGWTVIHTPGHTEGSCCLLKDGILISGDTLFANGYGRMDCPGGSEADMKRSLELLKTIDYDQLLSGHGPAVHR